MQDVTNAVSRVFWKRALQRLQGGVYSLSQLRKLQYEFNLFFLYKNICFLSLLCSLVEELILPQTALRTQE